MRVEPATVFLVIVGLALFLPGLYVAIKAGQEVARARASKDWPTTRGTITASGMTRDTEKVDFRGVPVDPPRSLITYEYSAGFNRNSSNAMTYLNRLAGLERTGRFTRFWSVLYRALDSFDSREALEVAHRYPEGREVAVYHDVSRPGWAVLEPGARWSLYLPAGLGGGLALLGLSVLLTTTLSAFGVTIRVPDLSGGLFSVVVVVAGFMVLSSANRTRHIPVESLTWPSVRGEVFGSYIERGWKTLMKPVIFYTYEVSGKEYTSTSISFHGGDMRQEAAQKLVTDHPAGTEVRVHYDPKCPDRAVLYPGPVEGGYRNYVFLSLILLVVGLPGSIWLLVKIVQAVLTIKGKLG